MLQRAAVDKTDDIAMLEQLAIFNLLHPLTLTVHQLRIYAAQHKEFKEMSLSDIMALYRDGAADEKVLLDVKGLYSVKELKESGLRYWRL